MEDLNLFLQEDWMKKEFVPRLQGGEKFIKDFKRSIWENVDDRFFFLIRKRPKRAEDQETYLVKYVLDSRVIVEHLDSLKNRKYNYTVIWQKNHKPVSIVDTWVEVTEDNLYKSSLGIEDLEAGVMGLRKRAKGALKGRSLAMGCGALALCIICCCVCFAMMVMAILVARMYPYPSYPDPTLIPNARQVYPLPNFNNNNSNNSHVP